MKYINHLFSDMDGTLLNSQKHVSRENIESIIKFTDKGGHFAVATGRSPEISLPFLAGIPVTAPSILYNGAGIYDFSKCKFLHKEFLPKEILKQILDISIQEYPYICIEAFAEGPIQLLNRDCIIDHYITGEKQPYRFASYHAEDQYMKFLLYAEPSALQRVCKKLHPIMKNKVSYTFSSPFYLEILPLHVSKGSALKWICKNCKIDIQNVAAIGDFDNDCEMLRYAALSAAPGNASNAALEAAEYIVSSNDNSCVSNFIEKCILI